MDLRDLTPYLNKSSRDAYGLGLMQLAAEDARIVCVTADVPESARMHRLFERWPERCFNFGIAEQNMMSAAAGLARCGKLPYVSVFAIFSALRAAEQARTDVAYPNLPVRVCATHSGLSLGQGGPTHHSIEDVGIYRMMPNMTVVVPADAAEVIMVLDATHQLPGPLYVRLSRATEPTVYTQAREFQLGKAHWLRQGADLAILACGACVGYALQAAQALAVQGLQAAVLNMASIKPLDRESVLAAAQQTGTLLVVEEHTILGGLGSAVAETLAEAGIGIRFRRLGIPDAFSLAAPYPDLMAYYQLDAAGITKNARELLMN